MKFFLLFFLLVPHLGFSQDVVLEDHDDEALVQEIENAKKDQADTALKIEKAKDDFHKVGAGAIQEIQESGQLSMETLKNMDNKSIALLQQKLRDAQLSHLPEEQVRASLLTQFKGKPMGRLIDYFPRLLDFMVDFVRSDEALPSLLGLMARKEDLKNYFFIWFGFFILSIIIKKYFIPKKWKGAKRSLASFCVTILISVSTFMVFYSMFREELSPTFAIIRAQF